MGHTAIAVRRRNPWPIALLGVLIALSVILMLPPSAASEETTDDGQEATDFYFAGTITFDDEPAEGVLVGVEGYRL